MDVLSTVSRGSEVNLPPVGELTRSELVINTRVWALTTNLLNAWTKGTITNMRLLGSGMIYKVSLDNQQYRHHKIFFANQLAYENNPTVIVPVGTRVIARYTDTANRSALYAGVIGEPPKVANHKRYFIFFDHGSAQYVQHKDIYVVCSQKDDVADDVHENVREFVRHYIRHYPEHPLVKLQKDQYVKAECNFQWSAAKVLEIDCSMAKILFLTTRRIEWIYRGSARLIPLCLNSIKSNKERLAYLHTVQGRLQQPDIVEIDSVPATREPSSENELNSSSNEVICIDLESEAPEGKIVAVPGPSGQNSSRLCIICCDQEISCALYKCGHVCQCYDCAVVLFSSRRPQCPVCRQPIEDLLKIYYK